MVALGASLDWAVARGLPNKNDLATMYQDYEARLRKYYGRRDEGEMTVFVPDVVRYK